MKNSFIEKNICCRYTLDVTHWMLKAHIGIASMRQFEAISMCTYNMLLKIRKKTFWKFAFSIVFTCFKHPKMPICIKIPVTLLQIVYICMTAISQNSSS